jgi:predicted dehydrogenase
MADVLALYGTGDMAVAYLDALAQMGTAADTVVVVGRREEAARGLAARYGTRATRLGGESEYRPAAAIVAVTPDALPAVARQALAAGARRLLIEKPAALSSAELHELQRAVRAANATAHVAFNRRFYPSVERCRELIREDGGVVACFIEVTEVEERALWVHERQHWPAQLLERWGIINSVHVLDLAFSCAGRPTELSTHRKGSLPWHQAGATFYGTGTSESGAALVYLGTWGTAGRWRVEITTDKRRFVLCPLEGLEQQIKNSFAVTKVDLPAEPAGLKPGLAGLVRDFRAAEGPARLPDLEEAAGLLAIAERMFGYV